AGMCLTAMGSEEIRRRLPTEDAVVLDRRRGELQEMLLVLVGEDFPLTRLPDIRPHLERSQHEGAHLDAAALLQIGEFLTGVDALLRFARVSREKCPCLEAHFEQLSAIYPLRAAIGRAISPEGDVADTASPELAKIRREKRGARDAVVTRLERLLAARKTDPARMDDLITLRNDRFVIPMREGDPAANDGVIQDRSSSGATLFVEPMSVVELNNRLRRLGLEEAREVERILLELTDLVREHRVALADDAQTIGTLDAIQALARFGLKVDGVVAERTDSATLTLREARHPLLILKSLRTPKEARAPVIPMSLSLGGRVTVVIVTGPNTGGKTVALKTVGLSVLMAQAGWPVPARIGTEIGTFGRVIADIGDEQSIESSLSTFSSHLLRIREALATADERTLVLLDELGAGTDPKEGAALGEAVIAALTERGARLVATTHHSALKTLSQHDSRIENASLVFDVKTLSPTYQFRVGLPGASYAIDIARRLGLPDAVVERALSLLGAQEKDMTQLLNELDERLTSLREQQAAAEQSRKAAVALEELFRSRVERLEKTEAERKGEALSEARRIVETTRREMEQLVREIRESQAEKARVKESHKKIDERLAGIRAEQQELAVPAPPSDATPPAVGDRVWIAAFKKEGEVVDIDAERGKLKVRIGDFLYSLDQGSVARVESPSPPSSRPGQVRIQAETDVGPELSLRGFTAEDALETLDRYLDDARLAGWQEVRIIHGKGEGILRRAVNEFLTKDPRVESKRLGQWNEGGDGVTIAKLRAEHE
ncbi:MAG: endonuclease MutS2, partial [Candidatus Zixiibacteriota bacterium]